MGVMGFKKPGIRYIELELVIIRLGQNPLIGDKNTFKLQRSSPAVNK